jgi:hypothetical protein
MRLGLPENLERVLSSTNLIENLFGRVREIGRRVKRWQNGTMVLRWTASAVTLRPVRANSTSLRRYSDAYGRCVRGIWKTPSSYSPTPSTKSGQLQSVDPKPQLFGPPPVDTKGGPEKLSNQDQDSALLEVVT